ncbi:hypothetical protein [Reyranella sp.]
MTRDPFLIEGFGLFSFSGGRTSSFMLREIVVAAGALMRSP